MYEVPYVVDASHAPLPADFLPRLNASLAAGQPGAAVTQFLRWVGTPAAITLVAAGGKSPAWISNAMQELATVLPDARHCTLPGQNHMVRWQVLGPALMDFFRA